MGEAVDASIIILSAFGGISLVVWTSMQAKIAGIKAEALARRPQSAPQGASQAQDGTVRAEVEALRAEVARLRDTSTQFDVSLENAVERLDGRVSRVETRTAAPPPAVRGQEETQPVGGR